MTIKGETLKFKTPIRAGSVLEGYPPGHVLLESEAVKHYGARAKPLEPQQELKPKRLYFVVELPRFPAEDDDQKFSRRRVRSGIQMTAKDRLESLMLARRSTSDLYIMKPPSISVEEEEKKKMMMISDDNGGGVRMKMRLPRSEVERLMAESKDKAEMAEKIMSLYKHSQPQIEPAAPPLKPRQKRVGFMPISEGEVQQLVFAS